MKTNMPNQDSNIRINNFDEVALGYTKEMAQMEAARCLNCKNPLCVSGCPVNINIPKFIEQIKLDDINKAYDIISLSTLFPRICGRVCPQEKQCEAKCIRGIKGESVAIGRLERFVGDNHTNKENIIIKENNKRVAIIGSGPSGLTCAYELRKLGYSVTIFEALHIPGGVLSYGIPEFRLPKQIVNEEINKLKSIGVTIRLNTVIGKTLTINELKEKFDAVFIGSGAGLPKFMGIKGENLVGVFSANEFLTRINLMKGYLNTSDTPIYNFKNVCVVGGGNVAMDSARCARRLGANVTIIYRRSMDELPARKEEVTHAMEEGIVFKFLTNPIEIIGNNFIVNKIRCREMVLTEADASGRRKPIEKENSDFDIDCDAVIMALGNNPNPILKRENNALLTDKHGCIIIDENTETSLRNVFAGGDIVTGAATVILAMEAGIKASININKRLNKNL